MTRQYTLADLSAMVEQLGGRLRLEIVPAELAARTPPLESGSRSRFWFPEKAGPIRCGMCGEPVYSRVEGDPSTMYCKACDAA